jgi:uronate dehydrogenase
VISRVAVTGARGTIGTALLRGLVDFSIAPIDLPESDVRDYQALVDLLSAQDAAVHLAWNPPGAVRFESCDIAVDNFLMICNVYEAARQVGVQRVIMASSVHADDYLNWRGPGLLRADRVPQPDSPYGATKVFMESLGRHYSQGGLDVICIRFGGVNRDDTSNVAEDGYEKVWLSHRDCVALVRACLESTSIPGGFAVINGISNNARRVHDYDNPFGWLPVDDADAQIP